MADDISLTQTLGGLRIANPDDSPISPSPVVQNAVSSSNSATLSPPRSSHSSADTVVAAKPRSIPLLDNSWHPEMAMDLPTVNGPPRSVPYMQDSSSYNTANTSQLSHRQSMPIAHQAQQQLQYSPHANSAMNAPRSYGPLTRPISGIYNHPNVSGGSQSSAYSAYRYGDDPPQPVAPPNRTSSRATPGSSTRGAPEYMLASNQLPPPRRSSRRISPGSSLPPTPGVMPPTSSYVENGPLHSSDEWKEKGAAVGIRREVDAEGRTVTKVMKKGVKDFEFGRTLGEGSYSTVLAATDRTTLREYAIKVLDKRHIIKEKKVKYVNIEKDTLNRLNSHPGIVRLYYTFQDERSLYFVLDLATNGELLATLKKIGTFDEECTRFYGAQILDAVAYMHSRGVIHRDLKPENVLLDSNMHIKITDFGTGKILDDKFNRQNGAGIVPGARDAQRSASFVGTAEYVSPELLTNKEGGKPTDLWAFGCIIYQLLTGRPPFKGATEYLTFEKILALDYSFPAGFPQVARDLVERLLVPDPSKRLTVEHVMNHDFFKGIHWGTGLWKQKAPRLKPYVPPTPDPIRLNG
jgi:3-phosphoinositide dependent protein kinase-1